MDDLNDTVIEQETDQIMNKIYNLNPKRKLHWRLTLSSVFSILVATVLVLVFTGVFSRHASALSMNTLSSKSDLMNILKKYKVGTFVVENYEESAPQSDSSTSAPDYSKTNTQVAGINEADIIKTDGSNIYMISQNSVIIAKAYPANDLAVIKTIAYDNFYPISLYADENDLIVIGNVYGQNFAFYNMNTRIYVFAKTNFDTPKETINLNGIVDTSREIDNHLMIIAGQYVNYYYTDPNADVALPSYSVNEKTYHMNYTDIHYLDGTVPWEFVTLYNFDLADSNNNKFFTYLGSSGTIYVSPDNIYIAQGLFNLMTIPMADVAVSPTESAGAGSSGTASSSSGTSTDASGTVSSPTAGNDDTTTAADTAMPKIPENQTTITKVSYDDSGFGNLATTVVSGTVLNQYSMDEYNGTFRIATSSGYLWNNTAVNHLYIFTAYDLTPKSTLSGFAPGESIQSTRFVGNRIYIVTYKQVDPLFVIDASNPDKPVILGELKVPGFSTYLEPYDNNHLIGFGFDTETTSDNTTHITGIKVSLFDVTDPAAPKDMDDEVISFGQNGYSYSDVTYNPKALLFDKGKNLIAFPLVFYGYGETQGSDGKYTYQDTYKQVYKVFSIDLTNGIQFKTDISHFPDAVNNCYVNEYDIERGLYIGDNLYTVSLSEIQVHSLTDYSLVNEISLPYNPGNIITPY